jgi:uncharacterized protein involved in type VI secretion and phage assembly
VSTFRRLGEMQDRESRNKIYGVVVGIVTDNRDPAGQYRVRVRFPWLPDGGSDASTQDQSWWCRISTLMAGDKRGIYFLPEVEDEVLVAFEHGDISRGYVVGSLWSSVSASASRTSDAPVDRPVHDDTKSGDQAGATLMSKTHGGQPLAGKNKAKQNDLRILRSRSGHQLIFNDNEQTPRVVVHSSKGQRLVLDDKDGESIEIYDAKEENYIRIDTGGHESFHVTIAATKGNLKLSAPKGKLTLEADQIELTSNKDTSITCKNFKMSASARANVEAQGQLVLKGATVNIN